MSGMVDDVAGGAAGGHAGCGGVCGAPGGRPLPVRKVLDHRGPLSIDVRGAWYFITICAEGHDEWMVGGDPRAPRDAACHLIAFDDAAKMFLDEAREYHKRGIWRLALFLVMPDHLHFIVHVPADGAPGGRPLPKMIGDFKRLMVNRYGLRFQRDFFDTRLRDDAHYAEKFKYICRNPVRKGLCERAVDWPYVIAFDRETGEEREHRGGGAPGGRPLPIVARTSETGTFSSQRLEKVQGSQTEENLKENVK